MTVVVIDKGKEASLLVMLSEFFDDACWHGKLIKLLVSYQLP